MNRRAVATISLFSTCLASCSMTTAVQARFVGGRVAFLGVERNLGCIFDMEIREQATDDLMWELVSDFSSDRCSGDDPHFYGQPYRGLSVSVAPKKLRTGVTYHVSGTATGSNYFVGAFRIVREGSRYRIEDMPPTDLAEELLENGVDQHQQLFIATNSQVQR